MMVRQLMWPVLLVGCAHAPMVTSEQVVQLPEGARQQIVQSQQGVDTANQNVTAGKVALDEAKRFRDIVDRELNGAKLHADNAQRSVDLGRMANSERAVRAAQENRDLAMREMFAARAKKDYADRLVDLRRAELDQKRAELDLARADFEYGKFAQLRANNLGAELNESEFVAARDHGQREVADARRKVADLTGSVESLRTAWMQRSNEFQTASRQIDIMPPPPPRSIDRPVFPSGPPTGGPNEGPSAPQSLPQD